MANSSTAIRLRVALHADMRKYLPRGATGPQSIELRSASTVADLLDRLGIPRDEVVTVGVNGDLAGRETRLHENDDITIFSQMEGG